MGEGTTMKSATTTTIELIEKEIAMKYLLQVRKQIRAIDVRTFDPDGPSMPRTAESFQNDVTDYLDTKLNDVRAGKFIPPAK